MSDEYKDTFARHVIKSRVEAEHFGSWRLTRPGSGEFWCRVTAADGLLRVSGDFDPIVFQGHLSATDDPIGRVAWMGSHDKLDGYVCGKARMGSTHAACTAWSVDAAHEDLRELKREFVEEAEGDEDEYVKACDAGLNLLVSYDSEYGVHEIVRTINDNHEVDMESFYSIGQRPSQGLKLSHRAVQRLHALLTDEAEAQAENEIECMIVDQQVAEAYRRGDIE